MRAWARGEILRGGENFNTSYVVVFYNLSYFGDIHDNYVDNNDNIWECNSVRF